MEVTSQQIDIPDEVNITIKSDGNVVVNNRTYDSPDSGKLPQLTDMLTKLKKAFPKQAVYIDPQKGVLHGRVVDVLNACTASKIENISFRAPAS
jgi:biopolymer transport protein ExbD